MPTGEGGNGGLEQPSDGHISYLDYNDRMPFRSLLSDETDDSSHDKVYDCDSYLNFSVVDEVFSKLVEFVEDDVSHVQSCYAYNADDDQIEKHTNYSAYSCHSLEEGEEYAKDVYKLFEHFYADCADHEHTPFGIYLILYTAFVLFLGCLFKWASDRFKVPVPYTVILLTLGIVLEAWESLEDDSWGNLRAGFKALRNIDPHMILNLFIPGLIFESAFNTNYHIFQKEREQALMLAGPGVIVNLILIGGAMHYFAWFYHWTWSFCFMFGSIVSATDPVAVVALLKELGASKRLSTLIEAESLLNDGTAFVLFTVFQTYAASAEDTTFSTVIVSLLQLAVGGVACGIAFGFVTYRALLYVFNDFQIEITFTLSMCYLAFYTAENVLETSGVLTVVFMGLWVSKNKQAVSPLVEETMHHFWEMIGFIANTVLFFVTGQVIAFRLLNDNDYGWRDFVILLMLYIMCHVIRALGMWQMFPALESLGYGCTWKDAIVMVYGGLRGAIGLALALIVDLQDEFTEENRDRVLFHVAGIVLLTLVVNATTIGWIVGKLGLNKPPKDTAALFKSATDFLEDHIHHSLSHMKLDKHYHGANWSKVEELQPNYQALVDEIFGTLDEEEVQEVLALTGDDSDESSQRHGDEPNQKNPTKKTQGDISSPLVVDMLLALGEAQKEAGEQREIEKRLIQVMKSSYWSQYERGLISSDAVHVLVEAAESAMDDHNLEIQYKVLKKFFSIPKYVQKMHTAQICGSFGKQILKGIAERLLFNNLGFAVELASGFIYAAKQARDFSQMLIKNAGVKTEMVESTIRQLDVATQFIAKNLSNIEKVYPEVHQAIQTSHAAHALLHHQKHEIESLLHQGVLDDAECDRVMSLCDEALNKLFHTGYSEYIKDLDDANTLLNSPLFSELTELEKSLVKQKAVASQWYDRGNAIINAGSRSKGLFVITRGTVDVFEVQDEIERQRTLSAFDGKRTFGAALYTKQRGECIDIWPLLEERKHAHTFIVTSEKCHGFWLNFELLHLLKESNIDFWDTLWKIAAVDVIRYYYQDSKIFTNFDFNNVESGVFGSPLSYYDGDHEEMRQIRIARGFGLLLNGTIVKISDPTQTADAPAILTSMAAPDFVAVNECVVLTLDVNRNKLTSMESNAKLAKLFGLKGKNRGKSSAQAKTATAEESASSMSRTSSLSLTDEDDEDDEDGKDGTKGDGAGEGGGASNGGSGGNTDAKEKGGGDGYSSIKSASGAGDNLTTVLLGSAANASHGSHGSHGSHASHGGKKHHHKHKSHPSAYSHVDFDMNLDESKLPPDVGGKWKQWTDDQCWSVLKHVMHKHEAMFPHLKHFHIHHITAEAQSHMRNKHKKRKSDKNDNLDVKEMEFSDSENLNAEDSTHKGQTIVALNDGGHGGGGGGGGAGAKKMKGSKWARPSMGPNAMNAQSKIQEAHGPGQVGNADRAGTLKKYRSSRFALQQEQNDGIMTNIVQNDGYEPVDDVITSKKYKKQKKILRNSKKQRDNASGPASGPPPPPGAGLSADLIDGALTANSGAQPAIVAKENTGSDLRQAEQGDDNEWRPTNRDETAPDVREFH